MATSLDLNLVPVARYAGRDYPELLSIHVAEPPRRAARGREADRLILYLTLVGNAPLPPGKQEQALADLSKLFYATPGSVTAALRRVAEELNKLLLERNLHLTSASRQGIGLFTQAVVRGSQLYLAVSGPVHIYLMAAEETRHFYDPEMAERGLGQGRSTPISFFQATLQPNDTLLLAAQPSPNWSAESLTGLHGQGPESLRRKLFNQAAPDLNAVLVQARAGKGAFYLPRPGRAGMAPVPLETPGPAETAPPLSAVAPVESEAKPISAIPSDEASIGAQAAASNTPAIGEAPSTRAETPPPEAIATERPVSARRVSVLSGFGAALRRALAPLAAGASKLGWGLRNLLGRLFPGDFFQSIPSTVMAFTALAVPVVVVTVSSVVYLRLGRDAQYEALFAQAQQIAERAAAQTDIPTRHADLQSALDLLNRAEVYRASPEVQALKGQLRYSLDELELIKRVNYQPAIIGGLPPAVNVTRIAVIDDELYLLDSGRGSVIRAVLTSKGYEVDLTFQCGPSPSGNIIDIAAWPAGYRPTARLLAMDSNANLLYCQPNEPPKVDRLSAPSADAWGQIQAFALDLGDTYVLDSLSKSVWIYWRSEFTQEPNMFFNEEIPDMRNVVDMTVNRGDLYLLHADNRLTLCFYSNFQGVPTRCSNPNFVDFRPGRESLPLIPPAPFAQIQNTLPPDPSLFLLEPSNQSIYHFSLRNLAFQRTLAPETSPAVGSATAFYVDNLQGYVYLAIGNQVFYAVLP
jgi:hypothetical protein